MASAAQTRNKPAPLVSRARQAQMDPRTKFTLWTPEDGNGSFQEFPDNPKLVRLVKYSSVRFFFEDYPKNAFYEDAALAYLLSFGGMIGGNKRGAACPADLNSNGVPLGGRLNRGLFAVTNQGRLAHFDKLHLLGQSQIRSS